MTSPKYSLPPGLIACLGRDLLLLHKRDFHQDAIACIAGLQPPLKVIGSEHIPHGGPCVITVNHYHRPGFGAHWFALAIASLVPVNMQWIMTGEFTYPGEWYEWFGSRGSQFLLERIAYVYDFLTMPPMPPREEDVLARAASVRAVLQYVRQAKTAILGLAPEGHDPLEEVLTRPASGVGRFALLLSRAGLQFIPVGAYEVEGALHVHFGAAYELNIASELSPDEIDDRASQIIMENIARLLPVHLRGEFA
jgi:hypothetical protein